MLLEEKEDMVWSVKDFSIGDFPVELRYEFRTILKRMVQAGGTVRTLYYDKLNDGFFIHGHFSTEIVSNAEPIFSITEQEVNELMDLWENDIYYVVEALCTDERYWAFYEYLRGDEE